MIPGKFKCSNVRADNKSSPAIRSAFFNRDEDGLKVQEGQNAMIKSETTDTIPLLRVAQQLNTIDDLLHKSKCLFDAGVQATYTPDSVLSI